jgi:hypothetical protein
MIRVRTFYRIVVDFIFIPFYIGDSNVVCIMMRVCGLRWGVKDRVFERLLGGGVDEPDGGVRRRLVRGGDLVRGARRNAVVVV